MSETVDALLGDMLAWLARDARPYDEVMEAWRTSCPRLTVWEDAVDRGFVQHARLNGVALVRVTPPAEPSWSIGTERFRADETIHDGDLASSRHPREAGTSWAWVPAFPGMTTG